MQHVHLRKQFRQNPFFQLLVVLFSIAWIYFWLSTRSQLNWWIENILVLLFVPWFWRLQSSFKFSNLSLFCIFTFLLIHCYGAQMSYTYNQVGIFIQHHYHLARNPYDRFVHFNFGLLIAYPMHDYLLNKIRVPLKWTYSLTVWLVLGLATLFELIEWLVAACTDSETGETYVATQGDVWDAHKDIALAFVASMLVMTTLYFIHKSIKKNLLEAKLSKPNS